MNRTDKNAAEVEIMDRTVLNHSAKEMLVAVLFALSVTLLMAFLDAYERLYLFTQMYQLFVFDEFAVFFPAFLAMGFSLFSYRQVQRSELEIARRTQAETDLRESEERYRQQSITDELTKLFNSRHFFDELGREIDRKARTDRPLSLILLDVDDFKSYNDTYGHLEGDKVLSRLGEVIRIFSRQIDTAFRYGGEEFTVILPETNPEEAFLVAERIRKALETEVFHPNSNEAIHITMSAGISQYETGEKMEAFVKRADNAMYMAKKQGKNRTYSD